MNLATQERPTYLAPVCVVCTQPITNPNYEIVCTSCQTVDKSTPERDAAIQALKEWVEHLP